jgi:hypothetical protein
MDSNKLASHKSRLELLDVAGTIVTMLLSSVCVVFFCAAANKATQSAATVVYATPAASAPSNVAAIGVASGDSR